MKSHQCLSIHPSFFVTYKRLYNRLPVALRTKPFTHEKSESNLKSDLGSTSLFHLLASLALTLSEQRVHQVDAGMKAALI